MQLHFVWITKYRKPILYGAVAHRVREFIREICQTNHVHILKGHLSKDHVHLFVSVPPHLSARKLLQWIKGKTSRKLLQEFPDLRQKFWGQHVWARGSFVASAGKVTDDIIMQYIELQSEQEDSRDDDFRITP